MSEIQTPLQAHYAVLLKKAEEELCRMCDEKPITDIWHSLCTRCAISAEEAAFEAQFYDDANEEAAEDLNQSSEQKVIET